MLPCIIRFGSGLFLVFLWKEDISPEEKEENEHLMESQYPYTILDKNNDKPILERVTHAFNYHSYQLVDTSPGMFIKGRGFIR